MKSNALLAALVLTFGVSAALGQDAAPPAPAAAAAPAAPAAADPTDELKPLVEKVKAKLRAGERTAAALAPELAEFDALLAKYRDQKTEEVGQLYYAHATLVFQVLNDPDKGRQLLEHVKTAFEGTKVGAAAARTLTQIDQSANAAKAKSELVGKPAPELTFKWSTREGLAKLSELKGKVVVLDFWATWCGPCVASFPQVRELAAHYKNSDVVILGVTSLQGRVHGLEPARIDTRSDPAKELALMTDYIKAKDITWTVVFSDQEVFNPDYGVTGIPHLTIIAPDGTVRHSGMHPGDAPAEKIAKIDALLKEFGKPVPAALPKS